MRISKFFGIDNKNDPLKLPAGALLDAVNVDVDSSYPEDRKMGGMIRPRLGRTLRASMPTIHSVFTTSDEKHLYAVVGEDLVELSPTLETTILYSGVPQGRYRWEEVGDRVYLAGPINLEINDAVAKPWGVPTPVQPSVALSAGSLPAGLYQVTYVYRRSDGQEGGAPPAVLVEAPADSALTIKVAPLEGYTSLIYISPVNAETMYLVGATLSEPLRFDGPFDSLVSPLPQEQKQRYPAPLNSRAVAYYDGRMYVAEYDPLKHITYIFKSEVFWLGLFDLFGQYEAIPGKVEILNTFPGGLLIATDAEVYIFDQDRGLYRVADYGVCETSHVAEDPAGVVYFWTNKGLCKVPEFANLTGSRFSVAPGSKCAAAFIEQRGYNKVLVATTNTGVANNQYS